MGCSTGYHGRNTQLGGCTCPWSHGGSAGRARRALVRHLLAPAARARRVRRRRRSTTTIANLVVAQLLHLEADDPDKDIQMYVNSPGRRVYAGLAIYDTMRFIKPDVATICCGIAMSMGSLILAGGAPGQALRAAQQPDPHPPAARAGSRARRPTSRSTPARRSRCASGWRRSTPSTPASRRSRSRSTSSATASSRPYEARGLRPDRPRRGRSRRTATATRRRPRRATRAPARSRRRRSSTMSRYSSS